MEGFPVKTREKNGAECRVPHKKENLNLGPAFCFPFWFEGRRFMYTVLTFGLLGSQRKLDSLLHIHMQYSMCTSPQHTQTDNDTKVNIIGGGGGRHEVYLSSGNLNWWNNLRISLWWTLNLWIMTLSDTRGCVIYWLIFLIFLPFSRARSIESLMEGYNWF